MTTSTTDSTSAGASAASAAATAIVFINADSGEGYITVEGITGDRPNLDPWHSGNALVQAVAAVGKPTIVVIHSVGPIILEPILALSNVVAVVWAGIPGQESGNGLVDVLYGFTSPSGKLPYTIAKAEGDYGTSVQSGSTDNFAEGLYVDYRHFDKNAITPRYEFGFGLCKSSRSQPFFYVPLVFPLSHFLADRFHSIHYFYLLGTQQHLHRQNRRQYDYRSRRSLWALLGRSYCHRHHYEQRFRDRRRSCPTVHWLALICASLAAKAAPRFQEAQFSRWYKRYSDFQLETQRSQLLGHDNKRMDYADR